METTLPVKTSHQLRVEDFMAKAQQVLPKYPCIPSDNVLKLRARLILEEALETIEAMGIDVELRYETTGMGGRALLDFKVCEFKVNPTRQPNLELIADGCADISVVTVGTLSACGIADDDLLKEVDRSNLDKFRGDAHRREDGKWQKPSNWQPPNIKQLLLAQGALHDDL